MYTEEKKIQEAIESYKLDGSSDSLVVIYDNLKYLFRKIIGKYYMRNFSCSDNIEVTVHTASSDIVEAITAKECTYISTSYLIKYVRKYFSIKDSCMPGRKQDEHFDVETVADEKPIYDEINFRLSLERLIETYCSSVQAKTPFHDNAANNLLALLSLKLVFEPYDVVDLYERRLGFYLSFFRHDMVELIKFYYDI